MTRSYIAAGYAIDRSLPKITEADAKKLTHLNIGFGHIREDEIRTDHLVNLGRLQELKLVNPDLKILLSIGGWGYGGFTEAASTADGRNRMAESALQVLGLYPFDGIDLDWEYPCYGFTGIASSPDDKTNFTLLLKDIREALDRQGEKDGRHYMLTIAAGADQFYIDGTEMERVQQYLDFVQLMTYDLRGSYHSVTGHHTNLYTSTGDMFRISADAAVRMFHEAGVPLNKIVIGAGFYSRMWKNVPNKNNGLYQITPEACAYGPDYTKLTEEYIGRNGYTRYWDDEAKAPYLFDGSTFITYDDEQSIRHKCEYIKKSGIAGIMFWEYGCDTTHSLIDTIYTGLRLDNDK